MTRDDKRVLISGGGPVGLLCAWLLGRRGVPVRVFDLNDGPQNDPRAATTHPATLDLLTEDGFDPDMARVGLVAPIFHFWDRPSASLIAQFDHAVLKDDTQHPFVVQCEQFKTCNLLLERLRKMANVEVLYGHEVVGVTQDAGSVSVEVRGPERHESTSRRLCDRRRRRPQHRAQASRHQVRRLHLAGALHRPDHAVRFRRRITATPIAAISPTPANGAIASRFPPTARPACGAPSIRPILR